MTGWNRPLSSPAERPPGGAPVSARISVAEAMHHGVLGCGPATTLAEVAWLMASHRVHCVVVTDEPPASGPRGIVSDLDLVAAASVRDLDEQTAGATCASLALTITPVDSLQRAAQLMTEHAAAHLLVVDGEGRPTGVLSTLDVAAALAER
jgi:CBS domain-containing protein